MLAIEMMFTVGLLYASYHTYLVCRRRCCCSRGLQNIRGRPAGLAFRRPGSSGFPVASCLLATDLDWSAAAAAVAMTSLRSNPSCFLTRSSNIAHRPNDKRTNGVNTRFVLKAIRVQHLTTTPCNMLPSAFSELSALEARCDYALYIDLHLHFQSTSHIRYILRLGFHSVCLLCTIILHESFNNCLHISKLAECKLKKCTVL